MIRLPRPGSLVLGLMLAAATPLPGQRAAEPLEIARTLAARYPVSASALSYLPALTWSGSLRLTELTGETRWRERALEGLRPYLAGEGAALVEPYRLTNLAGLAAVADVAPREGAAALARRAAELLLPAAPDEVVRHPTGWTDDMFMAASLLGRVAGQTGDPRYARVVGRVLTTYAERLQRPDGLFVHAETGRHAWGRGNGFAALGLVEALSLLPQDWPDRARVLEIYRRQMTALAAHQAEDGSWRQVVDVPASYRELTVTAMAVAAMARGVRLGWLARDEYLPVVTRGWAAVAERVDADGGVRDACASTAAGTTLEYYLERPVVNGLDDRAGGLVLLAALEMEELRRAGLRMSALSPLAGPRP